MHTTNERWQPPGRWLRLGWRGRDHLWTLQLLSVSHGSTKSMAWTQTMFDTSPLWIGCVILEWITTDGYHMMTVYMLTPSPSRSGEYPDSIHDSPAVSLNLLYNTNRKISSRIYKMHISPGTPLWNLFHFALHQHPLEICLTRHTFTQTNIFTETFQQIKKKKYYTWVA
jgi:hypothetical protein